MSLFFLLRSKSIRPTGGHGDAAIFDPIVWKRIQARREAETSVPSAELEARFVQPTTESDSSPQAAQASTFLEGSRVEVDSSVSVLSAASRTRVSRPRTTSSVSPRRLRAHGATKTHQASASSHIPVSAISLEVDAVVETEIGVTVGGVAADTATTRPSHEADRNDRAELLAWRDVRSAA